MADCTRLRLVQPLDGRGNGRTSAIDSTERRIIDGLPYSRGRRRDERRGRGERIEQDKRRGGGKLQHLNLTYREAVRTCHYPTGRNAERCTTAITKYSPLYYVVYKGEFLCSCNAAERGLGTLQKRVAPVQTGRRGRLARRDRRGNGKRIKQDRRGRTARRTSKQGENDSFREFPTGARGKTILCDTCGRVACRDRHGATIRQRFTRLQADGLRVIGADGNADATGRDHPATPTARRSKPDGRTKKPVARPVETGRKKAV